MLYEMAQENPERSDNNVLETLGWLMEASEDAYNYGKKGASTLQCIVLSLKINSGQISKKEIQWPLSEEAAILLSNRY